MKKVFISLFSIIFSLTAHSGMVDDIYLNLSKTIYSCGERIWPGLNWNNSSLYLISSKNKKVFRLSAQGKIELPFQPSFDLSHSTYRFENDGLSLNLDQFNSSKLAFDLLIHEGFHAINQKSIQIKHQHSRVNTHPENYLPRLEREELAQSLVALIGGSQTHQKNAATWFYRHLKHKEDISQDLMEGSAEYVEARTSAILALGCDASEKSLTEFTLQKITFGGMAFDKNLEHYRIGALGFMLAKIQNLNLSDILKTQSHPLTLTLSRSDVDESIIADNLIEYSAESYVQISNQRNQQIVDQFQSHIKNKDRLAFIPFSKIENSFTHRNSFVAQGITYYEEMNIKHNHLMFSGHAISTKACGNQLGFLIPLPALPQRHVANDFSFSQIITCF